jgi:hypothetical protein
MIVEFGLESVTDMNSSRLGGWRDCNLVPRVGEVIYIDKSRYYRVVEVVWLTSYLVYVQVENIVSMSKKDKGFF